ncbi:MAG: hypothetical protein GOV15_01700 [Candidatus Diapherotrites archaeon]|nr:hypothetical protein [Candidatus Diapherotrites archaeon]
MPEEKKELFGFRKKHHHDSGVDYVHYQTIGEGQKEIAETLFILDHKNKEARHEGTGFWEDVSDATKEDILSNLSSFFLHYAVKMTTEGKQTIKAIYKGSLENEKEMVENKVKSRKHKRLQVLSTKLENPLLSDNPFHIISSFTILGPKEAIKQIEEEE